MVFIPMSYHILNVRKGIQIKFQADTTATPSSSETSVLLTDVIQRCYDRRNAKPTLDNFIAMVSQMKPKHSTNSDGKS